MQHTDDDCPSKPLLAHLVDSAHRLPRSALPSGSGHLVLSAIISPPRVAKVLYPWAHLDAPREVAAGQRPFPDQPIPTWEEMIFFHAEWRRDDQHEDDAKMIFAIEAYNYTLPEQGSSVFYLSKLDTSGWSPRLQSQRVQRQLERTPKASSSAAASPADPAITSLTGHLTTAFLSYFLSLRHVARLPVPCRPIRHVSLHILARAQGAYLFPNSPENSAKKPLSDAKLIVWWRQTLSHVVQELRKWQHERGKGKTRRIDAYYMVPGMDKLESHPLVPVVSRSGENLVAKAQWYYGHPYTHSGSDAATEGELPPLPLHLDTGSTERERGIATLLPRFEDDPQSRFLDELAGEGQEIGKFADLMPPLSPVKASKGDENGVSTPRQSPSKLSQSPRKKPRLAAMERLESQELESVGRTGPTPSPVRRSPRMHSPARAGESSQPSSPVPRSPRKSSLAASPARANASDGTMKHRPNQAQLAALKSRLALDSVSPDEFWIRMGFRQECSSGNLVGAFFLGVTDLEIDAAAPPLEPQSRPRFTIPVRELQKCMRNNLQLDDCWWNKDREAIELTQEFDEERGRLLNHVGKISDEDKVEGEGSWRVGEGIVWKSVPMVGFSLAEVQRAEEAALKEQQNQGAGAQDKAAQPVTVLSVKRKKKT
ncbi:unnamed protein product [Jaminaea pallidilutea]